MDFKAKLKEVIDTLKRGHCTSVYARDMDGQACLARSSEACSWCLSGASIRCFDYEDSIDFQNWLERKLNMKIPLATWNDTKPDQVIPTLERLYDELQD